MEDFIATYLKMFFIMTPFFVLSVFLSITDDAKESEKRALAVKVTLSVLGICLIILFFGKYIFEVFGITLDAFRIGAGALLFLTAVNLVNGNKEKKISAQNLSELTVVPLAIPITIGPGTIGVLLIMGAKFDTVSSMLSGSLALALAVISIGVMLFLGGKIKKLIGSQGLLIISKITGLLLSALAAQLIFTGIKNFLILPLM